MSFVPKSIAVILVLAVFVLPSQPLHGQAPPTPVTGDWLLAHILSDPEQLNPLTSNDAGASAILRIYRSESADARPAHAGAQTLAGGGTAGYFGRQTVLHV